MYIHFSISLLHSNYKVKFSIGIFDNIIKFWPFYILRFLIILSLPSCTPFHINFNCDRFEKTFLFHALIHRFEILMISVFLSISSTHLYDLIHILKPKVKFSYFSFNFYYHISRLTNSWYYSITFYDSQMVTTENCCVIYCLGYSRILLWQP